MSQPPIAVVGLGGIFPRSPDPESLWKLIAAKECASREVPDGRWLLSREQAYDPIKGAADKVYSLRACFIENFSLDPAGLGIPADYLKRLDPVYHLALHAARQAFQSARTGSLDRSRVGVVLGNIVLPTDSSSALSREIWTPSFEEQALGKRGASGLPTDPVNRFVAGLPAGLIARALGLGGTTCALDAACASTLYALKMAVDELRSGRADAMLTGGVSRPESLYTQMGFAQLRALSPSGVPAPFDAGADGLVVGEGAGVFLLKRLEDARRDGDEIHAVITGIGLSNDVGGSLLAPNTVGQLRAMRAAYREAGLSPDQVDYIECHATGTPTGDPVEIASLKALWGERGWRVGQCALGSVKSNVGHLLTAAGAAGLMKMILAFKHKTLPPSANFKKTGPLISLEDSPFRIQTECHPWETRSGAPRRAAISGFGFGGINAHVLLEEGASQKTRPRATKKIRTEGSSPVAIVGMSTRFGAHQSLRAFQEAVLSGAPPEVSSPAGRWWGIERTNWFAGRHLRDGRWNGCYLPEVSVAAEAFRIPPKELEEMLPQQLLMLITAGEAIADARLSEEGRDRAGVFIGLGLDLNATNFHFRWSRPAEQRDAAGPALTANRVMGALGSVAASRIAREFRMGGPSFTVSSEESSGLKSLETAVRSLRSGDLDCAVVGAVDLAGDARQVLSAQGSRMVSAGGVVRPFDRSADGTLVGEGACAFILKRHEDALKSGDRIYAVIKGVGASSGGGELGLPSARSYGRALRRAYEESAVDPSTIGYLETHGSGVPEEDAVESEALTEFFGTAKTKLPCALGSAKEVVGHAGCAAGLASLARAALALYQEILPPMAGLKDPVENLDKAAKRFHALRQPHYWLRNRSEGPRRAGVSSFGSDGSCLHVVLEAVEVQAAATQAAEERRQPLGARAEALFALEADSAPEILSGLKDLQSWASTQEPDTPIELLARRWWTRRGANAQAARGLALAARDWAELLRLAQTAESSLVENPERPAAGDRIHYSTRGAFGAASVAFVFPGSGNQYLGMGHRLWVEWPEIIRRQDMENGHLRDQMVPEIYSPWRLAWRAGWQDEAESAILQDYQSMIMASVAHSTAMSDLIQSFGVVPRAVIGYSLGETAGLFAMRAWKARDEMLRRMKESSLFVSDLAGPCDAARRLWNLPNEERVDWVLGVIDRPADTVRMALKGMERAALLIVNAPLECVVGGYRKAVGSLVEGLGCVFLPLQGVSTVHFEAAKLVEKKYRDLHLFPTRAPQGVNFYSGAWGKVYEVSRDSAADSIVTQAVKSIDFAALIRKAYDDGVRLFLEMGPQFSCSRMIGKILGPLPHSARSACARNQDAVSSVIRFLAQMVAERVPVDIHSLYGGKSHVVAHLEPEASKAEQLRVRLALGAPGFTAMPPRRPNEDPEGAQYGVAAAPPAFPGEPGIAPVVIEPARPPAASIPAAVSDCSARPRNDPLGGVGVSRELAASISASQSLSASAHETFLRMSRRFAEGQARAIARQGFPAAAPTEPAVFMDKSQCLEYAGGSIAAVLGRAFADADRFPTRVRLPLPPLMLVDRILSVEGRPMGLDKGRVVTEHDVLPGAWYLDGGRIPTCIAVEAGQADLFLSGYLGIDSQTRGEAVYRLLDAEISFHQGLPVPGEIIRYDIKIDRFARQGEIHLFFFNFEATVGGKPLLSMKNGCAGFFSAAELSRGKGLVESPIAGKYKPGVFPTDWRVLAPWAISTPAERYDDKALEKLRAGDLSGCFGASFKGLELSRPRTLPAGRLKLIDRVTSLETRGGRYGLGKILAEADIAPDDWHLVCHFKDDNVMPGTLMYECCMHALRFLLLRMGWVAEESQVHYEPLPGVSSRLKCRGQVIASTRTVGYEISLKEIGYSGPEKTPYAIADAVMLADGKPIVEISNMSVRLAGVSREQIENLWIRPRNDETKRKELPLFDRDRITAFAIGKPSEAFGEPYSQFDSKRVIARLPGPPYQYLDRITEIKAEPWKMIAGGEIVAEYDIRPDEWYFASNRQKAMPFAVLLEAGLQPCGWLAAYIGSALTSPIDLSFRNLGGKAVQHREVFADSGTLTTRVKITKVSQSGGMIIQSYDLSISCAGETVYEGSTEFGFFTKQALSQQIGVRGAASYQPQALESARHQPTGFAGGPLWMPGPKLLMLDGVETFIPDGGPQGLGFLRGIKRVDPDEWFFKAHFYQDPVCPGSLGLESFLQLLKVVARERWKDLPSSARFQTMALGRPHQWIYRGQVIPANKQVTVEAIITEVSDKMRLIRADGHLMVDGLIIYQMKDFTLSAAAS